MKSKVQDRRKHRRHAVALEVQVQTIRTHETSRSVNLEGVIVDITEGGARLIVFRLSRRDYALIMAETKLPDAQIFCTFPGHSEPTTLFGKITYIDYREMEPESCCQMGIRFGRMDVRDIKQLDHYICTL